MIEINENNSEKHSHQALPPLPNRNQAVHLAKGHDDRPRASQNTAVCRKTLPLLRQEGHLLGGMEAGGEIAKNRFTTLWSTILWSTKL